MYRTVGTGIFLLGMLTGAALCKTYDLGVHVFEDHKRLAVVDVTQDELMKQIVQQGYMIQQLMGGQGTHDQSGDL